MIQSSFNIDSNNDGDSYDRVLVIKNSKGSDSGTYYCVAKTELDEDSAFAILTVEGIVLSMIFLDEEGS